MFSLADRLPLTRIRIFGAGLLYRLLLPFTGKKQVQVTRGNVRFELDLGEGIDLSLYLFGHFQDHVFRNPHIRFAPGTQPVVLDVGANIGAMALRFAERFHAVVYAFEPTQYAYARLLRNLALNPQLAERIHPVQGFVADVNEDVSALQAYASWRVDGKALPGRHPLHGGNRMPADRVPSFRLDDWVRRQNLEAVHLIKIDTDGHEYKVLSGARETLARFRPVVVFEASVYQMQENGVTFADFEALLRPLGYRIYKARTGKEITARNAARAIPAKTGIDFVAVAG